MRSITLFFLLFYCAAPTVSAQIFNTSYKFVTYTNKEGLSDNAVNKSINDRNGFLWVATKNGLNKFNGYSFKKYTFIPEDSTSLRSIWISDLLLDNKGLLWVSTEWGICYYDEKYDNFHYINQKQHVQVLYKAPMCTCNGNIIWIAAEDGLKKIDTDKKIILNTSLTNISDPQCILCDENNTIWIGTRGHGMYQYNISNNTFIKSKSLPLSTDAHIMDLFKNNNTIYTATSDGLLEIENNGMAHLYNKGINALSKMRCNELMCITKFTALTGENKLLCGSYNNNLFVFDTKQKVFTEKLNNASDNLNEYPKGVFNNLFSVHKNLWIATDNGLTKLNLAQQDIVSQPLSLFDTINKSVLLKKIVAVYKNNNELWIVMGKGKGGIVKYNTLTHTILPLLFNKNISKNKQPLYFDAIADTGKYLWAFANNKIDRYGISDCCVKSFKMPHTIMSADMDMLHNFWIGTTSGLLYFNTKTETTIVFDYQFNGTTVENTSFAESFPVVGIKDDMHETVWLTSIKYGLFSFNKVNHQFTAHRQPFNLAYETKNRCSSLLINTDGKVWYGTMAGLSCYNPIANTFTNFNSSNGLQSTYVYSISGNAQQQIWGRGNTGVFSFDIGSHIFKNFSLPKGQSSSFFDQKISIVNGQVLMGYEGGYNIFKKEINSTDASCKTFITHVMALDNPFYFDSTNNINNPAIFNSHQNIFRFNFTSVNFQNSDAVNFYYQLEGADKNWIKADEQSFAIYSNLTPGNYTFKVKASAINIDNNALVTSFHFIIKKPFWQTTTFIALLLLIASIMVWLLYKYRIAQIEKAYLIRSDISRNLHDEIGATLSSINIYSEVARKKNNNPESNQLLNKIYEASTKAMDSMSDIVWYINPKNDVLENMFVKMREYALPLLEAKNVQVTFNTMPVIDIIKLSMQQRQHVFLIFKEAINNIAKYAAAKNVLINVYKNEHTLLIGIIDDGNGFDNTKIQIGNGLQNMQHRCDALKGKLLITSTINKGTSIQVSFKIA